jgi:hypothetical protein
MKCGMSAEAVEEMVTEWALDSLESGEFLEARAAHERALVPVSDPLEDIEAVQEDLAQLSRDFYVEKVIGRVEYLAARKPLNERLEAAGARLAAMRPDDSMGFLGDEPGSLRSVWPTLSIARRRGVIETVIDRVEIAPWDKNGKSTRPDSGENIGRLQTERVSALFRY